MVEPMLALIEGDEGATRVRRGNVMARQRMIVLYDRSAAFDALVIGTSNKTEALLGYGTLWGDMPQLPAVSRVGLKRDRPGTVPSGGWIDLERPACGEEVGDIQGILWICHRRKEVACCLATNPFRDDIADVGRACGRRSDPQGHGLVVEAGRATDSLVDPRAQIEDRSAPRGRIEKDGRQQGSPGGLQAVHERHVYRDQDRRSRQAGNCSHPVVRR